MNPYSTPSQPNLDAATAGHSSSGPSVLHSIQTVWIAAGVSLLTLAIVSSLAFDGSLHGLLVSDDSYVASFAATVPVAVLFAIGCIAGWWFRSASIASRATAISIGCFGGFLWLADYLHDFGEGDEMFGYLGLGVLCGGLFGLITFVIRNASARAALSIAPHLCFGIGYAMALYSMSM